MIDVHAHILPWIDDGARNMDETLEMARIAVNSGITAMVATPHCNIPRIFDNYYNEEYIAVFTQTKAALKRANIPLELYAGMEVYVTSDVARLLSVKKILTLNQSRYLLVEFAFDEDPQYVDAMLRKIREYNIRPVIAHAERYDFVQDNPQIVYNWRQSGYLIQVNKGSFLGHFGKEAQLTAHRLLRHNVVSIVASDAHSAQYRTPNMCNAHQELLKVCSPEYLQVLFEENPRRICEDQPIVRFKEIPFDCKY